MDIFMYTKGAATSKTNEYSSNKRHNYKHYLSRNINNFAYKKSHKDWSNISNSKTNLQIYILKGKYTRYRKTTNTYAKGAATLTTWVKPKTYTSSNEVCFRRDNSQPNYKQQQYKLQLHELLE